MVVKLTELTVLTVISHIKYTQRVVQPSPPSVHTTCQVAELKHFGPLIKNPLFPGTSICSISLTQKSASCCLLLNGVCVMRCVCVLVWGVCVVWSVLCVDVVCCEVCVGVCVGVWEVCVVLLSINPKTWNVVNKHFITKMSFISLFSLE